MMMTPRFIKDIFLFGISIFIISCNDEQSTGTPVKTDDTAVAQQPITKPEIFDYPVVFKNWQIGDHENTRLVLKMYKAWDNRSIQDMSVLIADSLTLELPDGVRRSAEKDKMIEFLLKQRRKYPFTINEILAAYPLKNADTNDEWVNVLTYNKWKYNDGVRDSMLYQDLWKIRNGRISQLISLEQSPSRIGIKRIEKLVED